MSFQVVQSFLQPLNSMLFNFHSFIRCGLFKLNFAYDFYDTFYLVNSIVSIPQPNEPVRTETARRWHILTWAFQWRELKWRTTRCWEFYDDSDDWQCLLVLTCIYKFILRSNCYRCYLSLMLSCLARLHRLTVSQFSIHRLLEYGHLITS